MFVDASNSMPTPKSLGKKSLLIVGQASVDCGPGGVTNCRVDAALSWKVTTLVWKLLLKTPELPMVV